MNKLFKRALSVVLSVAMIATLMVVAVPAKAEAATNSFAENPVMVAGEVSDKVEVCGLVGATNPHFDGTNMYSTFYASNAGKKYYTDLRIVGTVKKDKITALKSSNSAAKVNVVTNSRGEKAVRVTYTAKAFNTKISCKVNGKAISCKFSVYKYVNPFKTLKIGSSSVAKLFNDRISAKSSKSFSKKTMTIKMKSDWAIYRISVYRNGKYESKTYNYVSSATVKNVSLNAKSYFFIYAVNKKTGVHDSWYMYR